MSPSLHLSLMSGLLILCISRFSYNQLGLNKNIRGWRGGSAVNGACCFQVCSQSPVTPALRYLIFFCGLWGHMPAHTHTPLKQINSTEQNEMSVSGQKPSPNIYCWSKQVTRSRLKGWHVDHHLVAGAVTLHCYRVFKTLLRKQLSKNHISCLVTSRQSRMFIAVARIQK